MVAVCAGYYVAAHVGLALRIPPATTSMMWPPNTVLTLALVLTPARRWLWCLAAALSAHIAVQSGIGWPPPMVLALFATNSLEALLAATGFRWFAGQSPRVDSPRRMAVLVLVCGLSAPVLSSFPDAALVTWFQGEPFLLVMRRRVTSNVLTALTLLPALLALLVHTPRWMRRARPARVIEALSLAALVLLATRVAFTTAPIGEGSAGTSPTPLVIVLPFLLWAALRFGTSGASLALLATALSAVEGAIARVHAADVVSAEHAVLAVQVFLIMLAVPLLGFAALIEERYRARLDLAERLRFEAMLARLSSTFVGVPGSRMPEALLSAAERLGRFVGAEASVLFEHPRGPAAGVGAGEIHSPLVTPWATSEALGSGLAHPAVSMPWVVEQVARERLVVGHATLPPVDDAATDRAFLARHRIDRFVALPVYQGPRPVGGLLLLLTGRRGAAWSSDEVGRVRQASTVLGQALGQWRTDEALRESESVKAAILGSIAMGVAVLSRDGRVVSTNPQWDAVARDRTLTTLAAAPSEAFLESCSGAAGMGLPVADDAREGVGGVLDGSRARFVADYCAAPASADRWFTLLAVPLPGSDGGALVTHAETTERRRAELSAQRSRDELAHVTRMSAMGELATSLAHRLSEPLSSIVHGADAARELLARPTPDLPALDGLLRGIIDHDRRASDVIEQLRALLHKADSPRALVDVNAIVEDIAGLVRQDAADRHVQIGLSLDPGPLVISADRVRIAQVLLNLSLNALDAMEPTPFDRRHLRFATEGGYGAAVVIVSDTGPGLAGNAETLFEPFHTTKASSMGMGLPIARTIVEAHGGRIWGAPTPGAAGASFFVSLPLAD